MRGYQLEPVCKKFTFTMRKILSILFLLPLLSFSQKTRTEYFDTGKKYFEKDSLGNAVAMFSKAISLDSNFASAYYFRGLTLEKYRGDDLQRFDSIAKDFKKCIALAPGSNFWEAYFYLGNNTMDFDSSITYFDIAIKFNSNFYSLYLCRGMSKERRALYSSFYEKDRATYLNAALKDYEKAAELNDKNYSVFCSKYFLEWRLGMMQEALDDVNRVLSLTNENDEQFNPNILCHKAYILCEMGFKKEGEELVKKHDLLFPKWVECKMHPDCK